MWSQVFRYQDGVFRGIFIDSAYDIKNIKAGAKVAVNKEDVEDWSICNKKTNRSPGNFSDKYLKSKEQK